MIGITRVVHCKNRLLIAVVLDGESRRSGSFEQLCKGAAWLHLEVAAEMTDTARTGSKAERRAGVCSSALCRLFAHSRQVCSLLLLLFILKNYYHNEDAMVSVHLYFWGGRNF